MKDNGFSYRGEERNTIGVRRGKGDLARALGGWSQAGIQHTARRDAARVVPKNRKQNGRTSEKSQTKLRGEQRADLGKCREGEVRVRRRDTSTRAEKGRSDQVTD